jgi:hypothetical protein
MAQFRICKRLYVAQQILQIVTLYGVRSAAALTLLRSLTK